MPPPGVWVPAAFFTASGLLEVALTLWDLPRPWSFWPVWEALGRGILHFLLAFGLWRRIAFCRQVALVYCLAALLTYATALVLALSRAPLRYPPSVVLNSLFQIPSCALLLPFLRSSDAAVLYTRPLIRR